MVFEIALFTILSASLFGIGALLQKTGLNRVDLQSINVSNSGVRRLITIIYRLFLSPIWFVGGLCSICGWFSYVFILSIGEVTIVRPLINFSLVVGVVGGTILLKESMTRLEISGVMLVIVGTIILGTQAEPSYVFSINYSILAYILIFLILATLIVPILPIKNKEIVPYETSFALSAGILYGMGEIFTKLLAEESLSAQYQDLNLISLLLSIMTTGYFFIIAIIEILSFSLKQMAFYRGRASIVLPITSSLSILIPIITAVLAFNEALFIPVNDSLIFPFSYLKLIGILMNVLGSIFIQKWMKTK